MIAITSVYFNKLTEIYVLELFSDSNKLNFTITKDQAHELIFNFPHESLNSRNFTFYKFK